VARGLACALLLCACATETRKTESHRSAPCPGGRTVVVRKLDRFTHSRGLITGHDYGVNHDFDYSFVLEPDAIEWEGYSSEPKTLLFCGEALFLRYLAHHQDPAPEPPADAGAAAAAAAELAAVELAANATPEAAAAAARSATGTIADRLRIVARFAKHHDNRYFFNWFGDQYWLDVPHTEVPAPSACTAVTVPNDDELKLGAPAGHKPE